MKEEVQHRRNSAILYDDIVGPRLRLSTCEEEYQKLKEGCKQGNGT